MIVDEYLKDQKSLFPELEEAMIKVLLFIYFGKV